MQTGRMQSAQTGIGRHPYNRMNHKKSIKLPGILPITVLVMIRLIIIVCGIRQILELYTLGVSSRLVRGGVPMIIIRVDFSEN